MFQCMVGVWLVRQDSSVLWKMLWLGAGETVVLEGWLSALCSRSGHVLFESLLHVLCGCGGISFRNSVDR